MLLEASFRDFSLDYRRMQSTIGDPEIITPLRGTALTRYWEWAKGIYTSGVKGVRVYGHCLLKCKWFISGWMNKSHRRRSLKVGRNKRFYSSGRNHRNTPVRCSRQVILGRFGNPNMVTLWLISASVLHASQE